MIITPKSIKAARTPPAIVANPPVMTAWISDRVITGRRGRIIRGASVYKEKIYNKNGNARAQVK